MSAEFRHYEQSRYGEAVLDEEIFRMAGEFRQQLLKDEVGTYYLGLGLRCDYPRINPKDYDWQDSEGRNKVGGNYPIYHEMGNIDHPQKVREIFAGLLSGINEIFNQELPEMLGLISNYFSSQIDGKSKRELFDLGIRWHDVMKLTSPTYDLDHEWVNWINRFEKNHQNLVNANKARFDDELLSLRNHTDHESLGGMFFRQESTRQFIKAKLGLSDAQIDYVARVVETHYELGKARLKMTKNDGIYDFSDLVGDECMVEFDRIINENPDMKIELGVFFLVDSVGKNTNVKIWKSDWENQEYVGRLYQEAGEDADKLWIIKGLEQQSINFALGKSYLQRLFIKS